MKFQECQHVLANGNTCCAPRLRDAPFCYFHVAARDRVRRQRLAAERKLPLQVPVLEDANTIQLALGDVVNAMLSDRIDPKKAALTFYALQTASANLSHCVGRTPEAYLEYLPELDSSLPVVDHASRPHDAQLSLPLDPAQPAVEPGPPRKKRSRVPSKKPVTSAAETDRTEFGKWRRIILDSQKKELKMIRLYSKAFAGGRCEPLPATIKKDSEAEEKYLQLQVEIERSERRRRAGRTRS